jgi:hypothetical protein
MKIYTPMFLPATSPSMAGRPGGFRISSMWCRIISGFAIGDGLMTKVRTLLLAAVGAVISAVTVQAADLENGSPGVRATSYHHHYWHSRCAFVQGVRGGTPLSVPFFAFGWSPGPTYEVGWRHCACCAEGAPVISVNY